MKIGFDNNKYLTMQSSHIKERINQFGDKLYLEFGGKLFDDYHASRWKGSIIFTSFKSAVAAS